MTKKLIKTIAMALAAVSISLPLSSSALAASHNHVNPPHKTEWRNPHHKTVRVVHRHEVYKHDNHRSSDNFVAGAIIGAVVGAIIANNS